MQRWNTSSPNHPPCRWRSASFALPAVGIAALLARLAPSFVLGSSLLARATPQTRGPGKGSQMSKNMERKQNLCCQSRMWCFFLTGRYIAYKCARSYICISRAGESVQGVTSRGRPVVCAPSVRAYAYHHSEASSLSNSRLLTREPRSPEESLWRRTNPSAKSNCPSRSTEVCHGTTTARMSTSSSYPTSGGRLVAHDWVF